MNLREKQGVMFIIFLNESFKKKRRKLQASTKQESCGKAWLK